MKRIFWGLLALVIVVGAVFAVRHRTAAADDAQPATVQRIPNEIADHTPAPPKAGPTGTESRVAVNRSAAKTMEPPDGATDLQSLLSRYTPAEQHALTAFYSQFPHSMMQFSSTRQLSWLKQHGYPLPEDILAAEQLSDAQLRAEANAGDAKALWFWYQRLVRQYPPASDGQTLTMRLPSEDGKVFASALGRALGSGSPFAGYVYANMHAAYAAADSPNFAQLVGYLWAVQMGDTRPLQPPNDRQLLKLSTQSQGGASALQALIQYQALLMEAISANPNLFATPRQPFPYH